MGLLRNNSKTDTQDKEPGNNNEVTCRDTVTSQTTDHEDIQNIEPIILDNTRAGKEAMVPFLGRGSEMTSVGGRIQSQTLDQYFKPISQKQKK